jgi:hypothetical protein
MLTTQVIGRHFWDTCIDKLLLKLLFNFHYFTKVTTSCVIIYMFVQPQLNKP